MSGTSYDSAQSDREGRLLTVARNSKKPIRIVLVDDRHSELVNLKKELNNSGLVNVIAESTSISLAASLSQRHDPDALFLSISQPNINIAEVLQSVRLQAPGVALVVIGEGDGELILRSFREGANEFLHRPLDMHELTMAVDRLSERRSVKYSGDVGQGKVIGIWGARGGSGTTTLACNLAYALAQNEKTMLVDLHINQGDLSIYLNMQSKLSLSDLLESDDRIDETLVESVMLHHESGVHVLAQSMNHPLEPVTRDSLETLIRTLRRMYNYVIIDLGHDWFSIGAAVSQLDAVCVTVKQDLATLFTARRKIAWLIENDFDKDQTALAVNAYRRSSEIDLRRISDTLGRLNCYTIRQDENTALKAINQGVPLRKASRWGGISRDIERMASQWNALRRDPKSPAPTADPSEELPSLQTMERSLR